MRLSALMLAAGLGVTAPAAGFAGQAGKGPARAAGKDAKHDETRLKALEAKLARNPKDAKLKLQVAEANYQVGHFIEYDKPGLTPREKYRGALKLYRRALDLNPRHARAAAEKKQIEDIYRQMGMPIPK